MPDHELLPDDEEQISRLQVQVERLSVIINGNPINGASGLREEIRTLKIEITSIKEVQQQLKDLVKTVRMAVVFMGIGGLLAALIFGIIKLSDFLSIVK